MLAKVPTGLPLHLNAKFIKKFLNLGDLARARQLFDGISEPDVQSWTILISAYTKTGRSRDAIKLYTEVKNRGKINLDEFVILAAAKACAVSGDLAKAKEVHFDALNYKFSSDLLIGNALIDMYGKCKYFKGGEQVFRDLRIKDVITWTSFCSCCVNCGLPEAALRAFRDMVVSGVRPNAMTLSSVVPACSRLKCLHSGREMHGFALKNGMGENQFVSSALVDMYSSCSSIKHAQSVFANMPRPDVASWNAIISAYFANGEGERALDTFQHMRSRGVKLDRVSWNSIVSGCADNGKAREALELLRDMQRVGCKPNQITVTSALTACTVLEAWRGGNEVHAYITRHCLMEDLAATTALVLIYAKAGDVEASNRLFRMMPLRDTVAWNTIIIANSMHGRGEKAVSLFNEMVGSGVKPNSVTFTGVLSGCSHAQMVDEGLSIFDSMMKDHEVEPDAEHYSCVVDVLSRGGRLAQAHNFIQQMSSEPSAAAWGALLGACRTYKNVELGRLAARRLFEIEPNNPGNYVLLFNILAAAKQWGEASEVRRLMRDRGIRKMPGCSWIRVNNRVHTFVVGDKDNDMSSEMYKFLDEVRVKMKLAGLYPDMEFVLQDLDGEEQEDSLCNHSEKLAVAFGILSLRGESSIRVFKNLRICGDCHNTIKFIAKFAGIRIVVRDSLRFHHFEEGLCSCRDFW
ncbi:pentatricopeptide repeat-containing protein At1g20230-like [Salvia miltiorrhiza]|uniref:Pentatricopeptide repeat protein n=1 Tax=Salvia miltiorrhiza TaxID=226208 RepID=A0A678WDT2_SALMI|nr:pentatricopeptide repeat-containing protein At1g20230-like [Salvia miltiorrhiza]AYM00771.1 pentatricopeptide repeat protein [Salvia miltiorrhiza]